MDYSLLISYVGEAIDVVGVLAISLGVLLSVVQFAVQYFTSDDILLPYQHFRQNLGRTIIIGLELLIAGDIVRSIAVPPSFSTVIVLAIIVLIRAFLSFQIEKGTEWHMPWHKRHEK